MKAKFKAKGAGRMPFVSQGEPAVRKAGVSYLVQSVV
jgi:hypothetical protein